MPLKNTKSLPPGGWIYEQKETGWKLRSMSPFLDAVQQMVLHRLGNKLPRASAPECAEDLEKFTCARIGNDPTYCSSGVKKNLILPFQASAAHLRNLAGRAVGSLSMLANGASVLLDWVGDGMVPVPHDQAQQRADVCLSSGPEGTKCKFNETISPFSHITAPLAEAVHAQLKKKEEMSVAVDGEDRLNDCAICGCVLKLKVHVPLQHIVSGTPDRMFDKFREQAPHCWIVRELNQTQTPA